MFRIALDKNMKMMDSMKLRDKAKRPKNGAERIIVTIIIFFLLYLVARIPPGICTIIEDKPKPSAYSSPTAV